MKKTGLLLLFGTVCLSCKEVKTPEKHTIFTTSSITYASGFKVFPYSTYTKIEVSNPWPNANKTFTYILLKEGQKAPKNEEFDAVVQTPVKKIVVTSTTHIPALEALGVENTLIGFPDTRYISSKKTRKNITDGRVKELGVNEAINTEVLLDLQPDLVVGFSINSGNKTYETIKNSGIPVVYNGDWVEETPLGKAEWIKFFAPFFNKETEADSIFKSIETEYFSAKKIASVAVKRPTVFSGAMYKDVWYMPAGDSWAAQFLEDANTNYLWKETTGTGSVSLNFENVLEKAGEADLWIGTSQFTSYAQLEESNPHYTRFKAFQQKKSYTFSLTTGETGGVEYYELAPSRPDLVLKDLIKIAHPELLPGYEPYFFKPLQ